MGQNSNCFSMNHAICDNRRAIMGNLSLKEIYWPHKLLWLLKIRKYQFISLSPTKPIPSWIGPRKSMLNGQCNHSLVTFCMVDLKSNPSSFPTVNVKIELSNNYWVGKKERQHANVHRNYQFYVDWKRNGKGNCIVSLRSSFVSLIVTTSDTSTRETTIYWSWWQVIKVGSNK